MLDILLVFIPIAKSGKMNGVQPATTSQNGYKTPLMRSAALTWYLHTTLAPITFLYWEVLHPEP